MTNLKDLNNKNWWWYLEEGTGELLEESFVLLEDAQSWSKQFHDYAFVVFPAAKAYEGYLKKLFLDLGFITSEDYYGKKFRIGKSLNPNLSERFRDESWVYDDLSKYCKGPALADKLWLTWKNGRNLLFHWFPNERNAITLDEAGKMLDKIIEAMDDAFGQCSVELKKDDKH